MIECAPARRSLYKKIIFACSVVWCGVLFLIVCFSFFSFLLGGGLYLFAVKITIIL